MRHASQFLLLLLLFCGVSIAARAEAPTTEPPTLESLSEIPAPDSAVRSQQQSAPPVAKKPAAKAQPSRATDAALWGDMTPAGERPPAAQKSYKSGKTDAAKKGLDEAAAGSPRTPETPIQSSAGAANEMAHDIALEAPATSLTSPGSAASVAVTATDVTAPVSNAPVFSTNARMVAAAPPDPELKRYQFLPLPSPGADMAAMPLLWPLLASKSLSGDQGMTRRAIILLHDGSRDAATLFDETMQLAGPVATGRDAQTLVIAPFFSAKSDRAILRPLLTDASNHMAAWDHDGWWQGALTPLADNGQRGVSSMAALDLLLLVLADKKLFPGLDQIIIAGYGRGGDLAQRYALFGRAHDVLAKQKLPLRTLVIAPQSYVYLSEARPSKQTGVFATPANAAACPTYQNYPYGLEQPNDYTRLKAANVARQDYVARDVTYLVGAEDKSAAVDQSCAATLQGRSVRERATNYAAYLKNLYGDALRQKLFIVPNIGGDAMALLRSSCGTSLLFTDGGCLGAESAKAP